MESKRAFYKELEIPQFAGTSNAPLGHVLRISFQAAVWIGAVALNATGATDPKPLELEALQQRNAALEALVHQQQSVIENLNKRMTALEVSQRHAAVPDEAPAAAPAASGFNFGKVNLSGEGGAGLFRSGKDGQFPNGEFRIDEAKLFIEAPIWGRVYFFSELNLAARETPDLILRVGEFYLDVENLFGLENHPRLLNLRVGRMDVPFGEEYQWRDAIDNPLISHSLTDFWGVDEGVELYGTSGKINYVVAVQNGSTQVTRDFTKDKAVIARVSYDPKPWLHFSVSGMRTGELDVKNDVLSELWFGGGWFRSIGGAATTRFQANLLEGDVAVRWRQGQLRAFGGVIGYDDNDPTKSNARTMEFFSVEAQQHLGAKLYAAARFSEIFADHGYPLNGQANMANYYFNFAPTALTTELWRLTLGLGYRFNEHFLLKTEYTIERGHTRGGDPRDEEDLFAVEAAFKF